MRPLRIIVPPDMDGLYHVVSRVVDRRMIFGEEEKKKFRELLVSYAGFSGITVAAWCLMDNHFHLLLHVPSREQADPSALPEKEILRRLRLIYGKAEMADIKRVLGQCSDAASRARYLERFTKRMGDLAMFMRSLKQRFSRWYNGRNRRKGTLWEDRYRSVAVEIQDLATLGAAARIVSAYIDLNPVRAGMVEDPAEYPWCGYARALVGEKESAKGLLKVWGRQRGLKGALAEYRVYLFEEGSQEKVEDRSPPLTPALSPQAGRGGAVSGSAATQDVPASSEGYAGASKVQDPRTGEWKTRVGIDARKVWEERKRGGRLPLCVMLRLKSRYLVDGVAIGSEGFLRKLTGGRQKTALLKDSLLRPTGYEEQARHPSSPDGLCRANKAQDGKSPEKMGSDVLDTSYLSRNPKFSTRQSVPCFGAQGLAVPKRAASKDAAPRVESPCARQMMVPNGGDQLRIPGLSETDGGGTNPELANGRPGVAMRFGQWGGLRVLRDLRVKVVG